MNKKALNIAGLALRNLRRKPTRTACLMILVSAFAFMLFGGSIMTESLKNGINSTQARLGADIMIVPEGSGEDYEGLLLRGNPKAFYFTRETADNILAAEGIERATSQFFLVTMNASCCAAVVQLVGFDPATDFIIKPWLDGSLKAGIGDGEIVVGNMVIASVGDTLPFFGRDYTVVGKLAKTATGLDTSVFMNLAAVRQAQADAEEKGMNFLIEADDAVSAILIKVKDGYDITAVARRIEADNDNVTAVISKQMITSIADSLQTLSAFIYAIIGTVWVLTVVALFSAFTAGAHERKKEFSILRTLGASRGRVALQLLCESALLGLGGGIAGIAAAGLLVFPLGTFIGVKLALPYLLPGAGTIAGTALLSLALSVGAGPLAAAVTAVRIGRSETYLMAREGET